MITLGKKYKDDITGFEGIATGRSVYLNGCIRVLLEGRKQKQDGTINEYWFDEPRLESKTMKRKAKKEPPGGPNNHVSPNRANPPKW